MRVGQEYVRNTDNFLVIILNFKQSGNNRCLVTTFEKGWGRTGIINKWYYSDLAIILKKSFTKLNDI